MEIYDGIICPSPYSVERIVFTAVTGNAKEKTVYAWQYDEDVIEDMSEEEIGKYLVPAKGSNYTYIFGFNPEGHNTGIYVTQHRYYLRWEYGLDFES